MAFYLSYSYLSFFSNATSHFLYAKDELQIKNINKNIDSQQSQLRNGWFYHHNIQVDQSINI